jgi:Protein of unknown function (DUF3800)
VYHGYGGKVTMNAIAQLVCGWPRNIRQRRLLVMLQGFVDDSGSDGSRAPYILAGFILPAEDWTTFSDDWEAELAREPRIQYFKMAEASQKEGQFEGMPDEFVRCKINDLLAVIERYKPDGIYSALSWMEYREILKPSMPKGFIDNPYQLLFPAIFDAILFYQKRKGIFPETVDVDFDEQGSAGWFATLCFPFLKEYSDPDTQKMLGRTPTMLDDKTVMPLQAADMLAWNIRREFDSEDKDKKWHWLYERLNAHVWLGVNFGPPSFEAARELIRQSYGNMGKSVRNL